MLKPVKLFLFDEKTMSSFVTEFILSTSYTPAINTDELARIQAKETIIKIVLEICCLNEHFPC